MTKREIFESYGIRMIWRPEHNIELSEQDIQETHEFAKLARKAFDEYYSPRPINNGYRCPECQAELKELEK